MVKFLTKPTPLGVLEQAVKRPDYDKEEPGKTVTPASSEPKVKLEDIEREHILSALKRNNGNRTTTAIELGISRRTLQYRLTEYQRAGWVEG